MFGVPDEKPARRHSPLPPKPPRIEPDKPLLARIIEEIDGRAESLKPAVDEYNRLRRISIKLQQVLSDESESDER